MHFTTTLKQAGADLQGKDLNWKTREAEVCMERQRLLFPTDEGREISPAHPAKLGGPPETRLLGSAALLRVSL